MTGCEEGMGPVVEKNIVLDAFCLLYTSDAADERSSVDLGGRRIIKKNKRRDESSEGVRRLTAESAEEGLDT